MSQWIPFFALPNVSPDTAIEAHGVGLLLQDDPRVQAALQADPALAHFFRCFTTPTGGSISPPALCVEAGLGKPSIEELIAFRNIAMISTLTTGWSAQMRANQAAGVVLYSNAFEFYPCTVGNGNPKGIIWRTPTTFGWDEATKLVGQCSPRFPHPPDFKVRFDKFLFEGLIRAWRVRYRRGRRRRWLTQLFRSLQMAYMAMKTPFSNQGTNIDWGTSSGLWVSAFEVLTHQGRSSYPVVADALEDAPWVQPRLAVHQRHTTRYRNRTWRSMVARLYKRIYDLRNAVLHGNPMPRRRLDNYPPVAVLLYRGLLLRLLRQEVRWEPPTLDFNNFTADAYAVHSQNRDMDDVLIDAGARIA